MQAQRMLAQNVLDGLFERLSGGSFKVIYADGTRSRYGDGPPQFTVRFHDDDFLGLLQGDLLTNFGEAYMDGRVDLDGDLADLMALGLSSGLMSVTHAERSVAGTVLRAIGKFGSLDRNRENIAHHYDLGNDFFRLWLDRSMTYSCAYFQDASDTLEAAQSAKIDHSLRKLRLQPGETLLDIGCGWGALVTRAAEHFGALSTGITLSKEQYAGANAAIVSGGLGDKADVRLLDYETLAGEGRQFDKIVSIGMIEHVGKDHLADLVECVRAMLRPGGLALVHLITGVKEGPINRWVEKYIFPGGYIPTLPEIVGHLSARDLRIWDVENLAPHYRMTLDHWSTRFERVVPAVRDKFDERFVRMWRLYLRASSAAFREGAIELHQILVSHGPQNTLPLTRRDLYDGRQ